MRSIFFLLIALFASQVCALEFKPFPEAKISEAQWTLYFDEVKKAHGATRRDFLDERLVVFNDTKTHWAFTTLGHPAHPAWIARQPAVDNLGKSHVNQIGYFAGQELPFANLFNSYLALTEKTIKNLSNNGEGTKQPSSSMLTYEEAQKLVQRSRSQQGFREYLSEFVEYSNQIQLPARSGCYLLAADEVKLIILFNDDGLIESVVSDIDSEKVNCYKRNYLGLEVKKPPSTPFAIEVTYR
jgi:hypothetical protein